MWLNFQGGLFIFIFGTVGGYNLGIYWSRNRLSLAGQGWHIVKAQDEFLTKKHMNIASIEYNIHINTGIWQEKPGWHPICSYELNLEIICNIDISVWIS